MQAAVTVNDGTFDGKSYSVWVGSDYNNPVNSTIAIKGGTFLKALNRQDVSRPNAISRAVARPRLRRTRTSSST